VSGDFDGHKERTEEKGETRKRKKTYRGPKVSSDFDRYNERTEREAAPDENGYLVCVCVCVCGVCGVCVCVCVCVWLCVCVYTHTCNRARGYFVCLSVCLYIRTGAKSVRALHSSIKE
jgi:hypothetical protein